MVRAWSVLFIVLLLIPLLAQCSEDDEADTEEEDDGIRVGVRQPAARTKNAAKTALASELPAVSGVAAAIDAAIESDLQGLQITPEALCDDVTFLRRVSLDLTGQIPLPEEVITFYHDKTPDKRARKIAEVVGREDYAERWSEYWTIALVGRRRFNAVDVFGEQLSAPPLKKWLKEQFARNEPFERVVNNLITATGEANKNGAANYLAFRLRTSLPDATAHLSQMFLGTRIGCARCHDHPFDKWTQQDFWGLASFLANTAVTYSTPMGSRYQSVLILNDYDVAGQYEMQRLFKLPPAFLAGIAPGANPPPAPVPADPKAAKKSAPGVPIGQQYRKALADWVTHAQNKKFAAAIVNRVWATLFGYGLVDPVDDIRPNNTPTHPDALKILIDDFNASGRDFKRLCCVITSTRAYQRSASGMARGAERQKAVRQAARAEVRPMTPEMLFSAIIRATGGEAKSKRLQRGLEEWDNAMMAGWTPRANQEVTDFHTMMERFISTSTTDDPSGKLQFEGTVLQALLMMHSPYISRSIAQGVSRFRSKGMNDVFLFAATLGRPPTSEESALMASYSKLQSESILWVLLNSAEFVTIH